MKKIKTTDEYGQNISVKNANLWYGDFHALKDITWKSRADRLLRL